MLFSYSGLEVDAAHQPLAGSRHGEKSQWELYRIGQQGGASEWLLEVTPGGTITTAQALTCVSGPDGVMQCP